MTNMFAGPSAVPVGKDELGRTIYQGANGQLFTDEGENRTEGPGSISRAVSALRSGDVSMPSGRDILGMAAGLVQGLAQEAWNGLSAPAKALAGKPLDLSDVWSTAGLYAAGSAPTPAPKGAIRSFSLNGQEYLDKADLQKTLGYDLPYEQLDPIQKQIVDLGAADEANKFFANNPKVLNMFKDMEDMDGMDISNLHESIDNIETAFGSIGKDPTSLEFSGPTPKMHTADLQEMLKLGASDAMVNDPQVIDYLNKNQTAITELKKAGADLSFHQGVQELMDKVDDAIEWNKSVLPPDLGEAAHLYEIPEIKSYIEAHPEVLKQLEEAGTNLSFIDNVVDFMDEVEYAKDMAGEWSPPASPMPSAPLQPTANKLPTPMSGLDIDDMSMNKFGKSWHELIALQKDQIMDDLTQAEYKTMSDYLNEYPGLHNYLEENGLLDKVTTLEDLVDEVDVLNQLQADGKIDFLDQLGIDFKDGKAVDVTGAGGMIQQPTKKFPTLSYNETLDEMKDGAADAHYEAPYKSLTSAQKNNIDEMVDEMMANNMDEFIQDNPGLEEALSAVGDQIDSYDTLNEAINHLNENGGKIKQGWTPYKALEEKKANTKRTGPEQAEWIAKELKEGRGDKLTDADFAKLDGAGEMRLAELYENGDTGLPMSMDEVSRKKRALEQGYVGFDRFAHEQEAIDMAKRYGMPLNTPEDYGRAMETYGRVLDKQGKEFAGRDKYTYHSTNNDYPAFNNDFLGTATDPGWYGLGHYTSDELGYSESYLKHDKSGGRVIPLVSRAKLKPVVEGIVPVPSPSRRQSAAQMVYGRGTDYDKLTFNQQAIVDTWLQDKNNSIKSGGGSLSKAIEHTKRASSEGYDGYNLSEGYERIFFHPNQMRSAFARFDPRLKHIANLSAAGAGAAYLGNEYFNQEDFPGLSGY